ncbi:MAG: D-tyrosyl-tRNA(Tyr) deacylase [Bacteroidales bacterium]|nr:D-tyrosyl-tRNA(Tyr) deacylase [Bacteroidales bacterium]
MRAVIQRVNAATLAIDNQVYSEIGKGLLVLLGVGHTDTEEDIEWLAKKIVQLRIFDDPQHLMNLNIQDIDGEIMIVSQFTLFASTKKGNRPSFVRAAPPQQAIELYEKFIQKTEQLAQKTVKTGVFGANMQISLQNNGPVTIIIDTKTKE